MKIAINVTYISIIGHLILRIELSKITLKRIFHGYLHFEDEQVVTFQLKFK